MQMQIRHTCWLALLALSLTVSTVPARGQSPDAETTGQERSLAEDRAETDADRSVLERLRQSLRENAELSGAEQRIRVSVKHGEVELQGEVKDAAEKDAVEAQVRRIEGVQGIRNRLHVAGTVGEASEQEDTPPKTSAPSSRD